jgi:methyltransferase (TIGR00027 family)
MTLDKLRDGSTTARVAAAYRARATARPDPVCVDEWAKQLGEEDDEALLVRGDALVPSMELGVALRTAWLDRRVRAFEGDQVVLLGAGLDTRAARLSRSGLAFFEVDHPSAQAHKRAKLERLASYPQSAAEMVPCDLEAEDFGSPLLASGFRRDRPTLVVWEGVTAYLSEQSVRATVRRLSALLEAESVLCFDHLGPATSDSVAAGAREFGEPFRFMTADVGPLLRDEGFGAMRVMTMADLQRAERPAADGGAVFARWFLVEATSPGWGRKRSNPRG